MVKKNNQTSLMQMNEFSNYLKYIKILLKDFKASVEPYLDESLLKNKQEQLTSIENTINGFNQAKVKVPDEYNDFRLNLILEIKHANDAINGYQGFIKILGSYIIPPISLSHREQEIYANLPINVSSQVNEPEGNFITGLKKAEITLSDIIQAKIIPPGTVIVNHYQGRFYKGKITEDGKIITKGSYKGTYPDPNSATQAITKLSIDGWLWWHIFIDKWKRPLDDLRVIYLERMA